MPRPNPLTAEILAAFLAALRGGALVEAAAASVGMTISTLYGRRKRDPGFDSAWTEAAEASMLWCWDPKGRYRMRAPGCKRRLRFGARRRAAFLASLERDCNSSAAARATGVHPSTVVQAVRRDPKFARDNEAALERGYARLERELALERERSVARMKRFLDRGFAPTGEPTSDPDHLMRLLKRYERPERARGRRDRWARPELSQAEAIAALEQKLRHLDLGPWGQKLKRGPPPLAEAAISAGPRDC